MGRGLIDAWSLEPLGVLRLGGQDFPVPPLTLGRFQRLLAADTKAVLDRLLAEEKVRPPLAVRVFRVLLRFTIRRGWDRTKRALWWTVDRFGVGRGMHRAAAVEDLAALVVPGLSPSFWREHGSQGAFSHLFMLFADGHEWAYVADAIRFGEPLAKGEALPDPDEITEGLIVVAKETGHTVEELERMRLEGFYRLVAALRAKSDAQRAESLHPAGGPLPGVEYMDSIPADIEELIRKAREGNDVEP